MIQVPCTCEDNLICVMAVGIVSTYTTEVKDIDTNDNKSGKAST